MKYKDLLKHISDMDPLSKDPYRVLDDVSASQLCADAIQEQHRFNSSAKEWYYYDGQAWKRDDGGLKVERSTKKFVRAMVSYANNRLAKIDNPSQDDHKVIEFYGKYGNRNNRKRLIDDMRENYCISQSDLDRYPDLLNCKNGVLNLKTFEFVPNNPNLLLSKTANVKYIPGVRSETFETFMNQIMLDDTEKIEYLQKIFGYCMTGENPLHQAYICYGSSTRNGKSTLLDTIGCMLGDYAMNIQPETLAKRENNTRNASGDIARLDGCRFLHMGEPPKRMLFNAELFKNMTGGDPITARNMYEREFEFHPVFKLMINTNYLPIITDDTAFSSDRIKVITFDRHFAPAEQDRTLKKRLQEQENLTGILNWCLEGLKKFYAEGSVLQEPASVADATKEYRENSDKIGNFITDCLCKSDDPKACVSIADAYREFSEWCRINGFGTEGKHNFISEMKSKGVYAKSGWYKGQTVKNVISGYVLAKDLPDNVVSPKELEDVFTLFPG